MNVGKCGLLGGNCLLLIKKKSTSAPHTGNTHECAHKLEGRSHRESLVQQDGCP